MSFENAQKLVSKMRDDKEFRNNVQGMPDNQALKSYLREEGYEFEELDLIKSMAACMTGLDQMMQKIRP